MLPLAGEPAPNLQRYVDSPALLPGLDVLKPRRQLEVVNLGIAVLDGAIAGDALAIVVGRHELRHPDGGQPDYIYDDQVEVARILDISGAALTVSADGQLPVKPSFASFYYKRRPGRTGPEPTLTPLLPGMEYTVVNTRGSKLVRFAISEAGTLAVGRTGRAERLVDVRIVGASENPGGFIRRPAVQSAAAVAVRAGGSLGTYPTVSQSPDYSLHIAPGQWAPPVSEQGQPAVVSLASTLTIPSGRGHAYAVWVAQQLEQRQQRRTGERS